MLVKAELPDSVKDKLVVAAAGGNRIDSKQPTGGNSSALEFSPSDTNSTVPTFTDNSFSITGSYATISGTSNVKMNYAAKDSSMYSSGVDALLTSTAANQPMVVGTTDGNTENTVYMMIPAPIPICCRFDITIRRGYISAVNNATIKLSANAHRLFA